jgi:hypothetical protein
MFCQEEAEILSDQFCVNWPDEGLEAEGHAD